MMPSGWRTASYNALDKPYSVYEVHLGSWKRHEEDNRFLTYLEFAEDLVAYVKETGFTHVEFMPYGIPL
jgi:1,4-alpha-glucan branching enzyme